MIIGLEAAQRSLPGLGGAGPAVGEIHGGDIGQYQHIVASRIAKIEASHPPCEAGFQCRVVESAIGQVRATYVQSSPLALTRSAQCIAADPHNEYLIGLNLAGDMVVDHYRFQTRIQATQMFLLDKTMPYQTTFTAPSERIVITVPRRLIEHQLPEPSRYLRYAPSLSDGLGNLAYQHLALLLKEGPQLDDVTRVQLVQMCLDLIAMSFRSCDDAPAPAPLRRAQGNSRILLARVQAYARCMLGDPALGPEKVAEGMGLSRRYVHKLFADHGTTFGAWVRDQRLAGAHALLADPRFLYLSIKEIALQQGFNDIPNFNRQFKARYRLTPTQLRAGAGLGAVDAG